MSKNTIFSAMLAVLLIGGTWWYSKAAMPALTDTEPAPAATEVAASEEPAATTAAATEDAASTAEASISTEMALVPDMILGNPDAPVTVMEYASFTCPHCANFHATVWNDFKANYIDTGKVKFVYREVYFDKFGLWAAMVARCAGAEKYFGISDMLYDGQKEWLASSQPADIAAALSKIGIAAGMTTEQVDACLKDDAKAKAMVAAYQTNATTDQVESTPTFIINGEKKSGEMSYADFAAILDAALAK